MVSLRYLQADIYDALLPIYGPEVAAFIAAPLVERVLVWLIEASHYEEAAR